jgi:hypothetical protein
MVVRIRPPSRSHQLNSGRYQAQLHVDAINQVKFYLVVTLRMKQVLFLPETFILGCISTLLSSVTKTTDNIVVKSSTVFYITCNKNFAALIHTVARTIPNKY